MAIGTAIHGEKPNSTMSFAISTEVTPLMAAIERSISFTSRTNIRPSAMMPTTVLCTSRFERLRAVRNTSLCEAKKIHSATRPMTIGRARKSLDRSSPKLRRRTGGSSCGGVGHWGFLGLWGEPRLSREVDAFVAADHGVHDLLAGHVL